MSITLANGGGAYYTAITANASANTKGNWSQLLASTPEQINGMMVSVSFPTVRGGVRLLIDIGTGAAASETAVLSNIMVELGSTTSFLTGCLSFYAPISVVAGTRISARCQSNTGGSDVTISAQLIGGTGAGTVVSYGATTASSAGSQIDPGATPDTKGAYTQITSATSQDHTWLGVVVGGKANLAPANATFALDIASGGAGSESPFINDIYFSSASTGVWAPMVWTFQTFVATGTRLSARAKSQTADATDRLFDVILYGGTNPFSVGVGYLLVH